MTTRRSRVRVPIALLAGAALLLAGCGDDNASGADESGSESGDSAAADTSPLTGLPYKGEPPKSPILTVKLDNTSSAHPQVGLNKADLVVEELVEGGVTRLAAMYHSSQPKEVGPVRSMRDSDTGIVLPTGGVLVASGGAPGTTERLKEAGVKTVTEDDAGFTRDGSRTAPYNLMATVDAIAKAEDPGKAAEPYLPFGDAQVGGKRVDSFAVTFSSSSTTRWESDGGSWVRTNAPVIPRQDFVADNVLVLSVKVGDVGYLDPGGNPVPETKFEGEGKAQLFTDGKVVNGTWSKDAHESNLTLQTKNGEELTVPAGRTFIELMPKDEGNVRIR